MLNYYGPTTKQHRRREVASARKANLRSVTVIAAMLVAVPATASEAHQNNSVLSTVVSSFQVKNATMEEVLRALRATNEARILIGFENVSRHAGDKRTMSLSFANATVGEILDGMCRSDKRYRYQTVDGLLVHVYPKDRQNDTFGLLGIRVKEFSVDDKILPAAIIERIGELAPELASYLTEKQNEYFRQRGIVPSFPGVTMHGNMDPQVSLHLHDMTVREVLNATVLYSLRLNQETAPDWAGTKIPPTSWMYEFVVDPAAPTGLGGYPKWVAF
jgi:hypothetical protein